MDKIVSLINNLIKSKIIKNPTQFIYVIICVSVLYFPRYVGDYINDNIRVIVKEEVSNALDQRDKEVKEKHNELVNTALTLPPKIDNELRKLQQVLKADRTFFCEYGNSLTSLSGNLFTYFTMRNEQNASGVIGIKQQYQQQSTDNFKFNFQLKNDKVYSLTNIEEIKESDPIFYTMLKKNGTKKICIYLIEIEGTPRGFIGVSYSKEVPCSHDKILFHIAICAREIIALGMNKEI